MGADGGSIPKRCELVRQKRPSSYENLTKSKDEHISLLPFITCRLSKEPLQQPLMADYLGNLYKKEAVLQYFIDKKLQKNVGPIDQAEPQYDMIHSNDKKSPWLGTDYLVSMKNLVNVTLTPNPALCISQDKNEGSMKDNTQNNVHNSNVHAISLQYDSNIPLFICPLTRKELNGTHKFVFHPQCGCVFAEEVFLHLLQEKQKVTENIRQLCPVCETVWDSPGDLIPIAPSSQEQKVLYEKYYQSPHKKLKKSKNKT